jgi:hypothetical protein
MAIRLEIAARHAAEAGLEVWFAPFTCDLTAEEMLAVLADCAELSLVNAGFLPGATLADRLDLLTTSQARLPALIAQVPARLNDFLGRAVTVVRARFGGRITYASIPFEAVNRAPFDLVSVDAYRSIEIADRYRDAIRAPVAQGKPVAITEFGCATYKGAADKGARGGMIVEWDDTITPLRLDGDYTRDETEQVTYLRELPTTTCRTAPTAATTWTWPRTAWSRSSRTAWARPTPTWRGNRSPRSARSPTTTAADRQAESSPGHADGAAPTCDATPLAPYPLSGTAKSMRNLVGGPVLTCRSTWTPGRADTRFLAVQCAPRFTWRCRPRTQPDSLFQGS